MPNNMDPIQQAAYQSLGITQGNPAPVVDPIQQAAYLSMGISNPQVQQPEWAKLAANIVPYANSVAQMSEVPLVGAAKLGQSLVNLPHTLAVNYAPSIANDIPYSSANMANIIGNLTGRQLPNNSNYRTAEDISSGVEGAFLPGGAIGQAVSGAAQSPNSPILGAGLGAVGHLVSSIAGGLKSLSMDPITKLSSKILEKNSVLDAATESKAQSTLSDLIAARSQNASEWGPGYSGAQQAVDHPIPGLSSPSRIPGSSDIRQQTSNEFNRMFGDTPTGNFYQQHPELFAENYSMEPELSGITGTKQASPVDKLIMPGFGDKLNSSIDPNTNFGSYENPIKPGEAYKNLISNPTVGNAIEAHGVFSMAKKSPYITPAQSQLLNTAAANIKSNMIIPGLKDFDSIYGTNITDPYLSADAPYKQEMIWKGISPSFDAATSGNWLPEMHTSKNISGMLQNGIKSGAIQPGSLEYSKAQDLVNAMVKNNQAKALNNQILATKIAKYEALPSPIKAGISTARSLPYLAGFLMKPFGMPLGNIAGQIGAQFSNQG